MVTASLEARLERVLTAPLLNTSNEGNNEAIEALHRLSALDVPTNSRFHLRSVLEQHRIESFQRILDSFKPIQSEVEKLAGMVSTLEQAHGAMEQRLQQNRQVSDKLLIESTRIQQERQETHVKKAIVQALKSRFLIQDSDLELLKDAHELTEEFFGALRRLQQVQQDSRILLTATTEHNRLGVDLSDFTGKLLEDAYDKIFNHTHELFATLSREIPELTVPMKNVLQALKTRPVLLQTVVDDIVAARKETMARVFHTALTIGGAPSSGGHSEPIDARARDPHRYIGDMLALIHQHMCSEREILEQLFLEPAQPSKDDEAHGSGILSSPAIGPNMEALLSQSLDRIFEGTIRSLGTRIERVLGSEHSIDSSYKLANMIQFYARMVEKVLTTRKEISNANSPAMTRRGSMSETGESAPPSSKPHFLEFLENLTRSSFKLFYDVLNQQASALLKLAQTPDENLSVPQVVKSVVVELKALMASYDSSLVLPLSPKSENNGFRTLVEAEDREKGFQPILVAIVDPLIQLCSMSADRLSTPFKRSVFMLNCLHYILTALQYFPGLTKRRCELLETQIGVHVDMVVQEELINMLRQSGLLPLMEAIQDKSRTTPLSRLPSLDGKSLHSVLTGPFDTFLASIHFEVGQHLQPLLSARQSKLIAATSVRKFVESYRKMVEAILDSKNGYEFPQTSVLTRTAEDVETVVGISFQTSSPIDK